MVRQLAKDAPASSKSSCARDALRLCVAPNRLKWIDHVYTVADGDGQTRKRHRKALDVGGDQGLRGWGWGLAGLGIGGWGTERSGSTYDSRPFRLTAACQEPPR